MLLIAILYSCEYTQTMKNKKLSPAIQRNIEECTNTSEEYWDAQSEETTKI